jgi:tetratricopeptide (TPR) repeat protein
MVRARSLAAMEKSAEAMVVLEELRRRDPESVAPFVELAAIRRNVDGPEAAHDIIVRSKMDLTQPDNVAGLQSIASDLVALDRGGEAMKRIDAAIAVSPDSAIHHQLRARVLARTKRADEARESVARALELDAELPQALELMSVLEQRDGNLDSAVAYAERAAAADPENADYAYTAAQLFRLRGDDDKALEILREAVKRDPGHAAACNDLAFGLATNGRDLYQALDLAERAVRVQRGADTLDTLGWVQLKRGDAAAADATFRKALELRPESPSIQYHLGLALIEGGDKDQGAELLRKAISGDGFPEAEQARQELARLEG